MTPTQLAALLEPATGTEFYVRGAGGGVTLVSVPKSIHQRETFASKVLSGALQLVDEDDVVKKQSRWGGTVYSLRKGAATIAPATIIELAEQAAADPGDDVDDDVVDDVVPDDQQQLEQPTSSAGKSEWVAYARSKGFDGDPESVTKQQLVDQYGG